MYVSLIETIVGHSNQLGSRWRKCGRKERCSHLARNFYSTTSEKLREYEESFTHSDQYETKQLNIHLLFEYGLRMCLLREMY
mmetsp:Transcript_27105/g.62315  ORF Transcript_27105/g.62315 Transcript_27105/m.62315 type:complete len:82 (+) Transcript_27105:92-337(+)